MTTNLDKLYRLMLTTALVLGVLAPSSMTVSGAQSDFSPTASVAEGIGVGHTTIETAPAAPGSLPPGSSERAETSALTTPSQPGGFASPSGSAEAIEIQAAAAFTSSLNLDGTGDYVRIPFDETLNDYTDLTIEAWVRRASSNRCETIVGKDRDVDYWLGFCNHVLRFYLGGSYYEGESPVPAGVWTHVAVTWRDSTNQARFYVNGQADGYASTTSNPAKGTGWLYIGGDPVATLREFSGNMAEVRLWSQVRTQNQIRHTMYVALEESLPGLMANWHLVRDYEDNVGGHDGTAWNSSLDGPAAPPQPAVVPVDENFNALPAARSSMSAVYVPDRNQVLVMGGFLTDDVYAMDAGTGDVTALSALPNMSASAAAAYVPSRDTAYLFGGRASIAFYSQSIMAVNPDTGYVRTLTATLPANRSKGVAIYHPGLDKIYLMGGEVYNPISGYSVQRNTIVFDPISETVAASASDSGLWLPQRRCELAGAYSSATGKIYVFGGMDGDEQATDTIYEMTLSADGESGSVMTLTSSLPQPTYGLSAIEDPYTQLIYLLGGKNTKRIAVFDPLTGQVWETPIEMEERIHAGVVYSPHNRHALLIGGADASGTSQDDIWRIPLGDGPAVPLGRWDFPSMGSLSDGVQISSIHGDEDHVLVGTAAALGTDAEGAWRFDPDGGSYRYTPARLGSASGVVYDVRYNPQNEHAWIATGDAGAVVFDAGSDSATPLQSYDSSVLGTNTLLAIDLKSGSDASTDGEAFMGTYGQGLKWQSSEGSGWSWKTHLSGGYVTNLTHRGTRDLWAISNSYLAHLVYNQDTGSATETIYNSTSTLCSFESLDDLAFGPNEDWWLASRGSEFSSGGVCFIPGADTPGAGTSWSAQDPVGDRAIDIDADADGRIWVAFEDDTPGQSGGLAAWETERSERERIRKEEYNWENAPVSGNISDTAGAIPVWESGITAVGAVDERVWAGTRYQELVTLAQRWGQLDDSNDIDAKLIQRLWTVRGRLFLASTSDLYILMPDGKSWDNRPGVPTFSVLGDRQGRVWVGTNNGVRRYTASGWDTLTDTLGSPPSGAVYAMAEDQDGRIWMGSNHGLTLYDRERFVTTFTAANSDLPTDTVRSLLVDRDNRLWVGTSAGLARLDSDDSPWRVYTTTHGLPGDAVHDLAQRGNGTVAVSTDGGLGMYFDAGDSFWTPSMPIDTVDVPLAVDELGRLWAGNTVSTASWQSYYWTNSGLRSSTVSDNAADGAGRVWFGHFPDGGVSVRGAFLPPLGETVPIITGLAQRYGTSGDTILIQGSGFGDNPADVSVSIGGVDAEVSAVADGHMSVRLNDDTVSGDVSVSVDGVRTTYRGSDGGPAFCAVPQVDEISPTGGNAGVMVNIRGSNFDPGARVFVGSASSPHPVTVRRGPTRIELFIQLEDGNGYVRVENRCHDDPDDASDTSDVELRHIRLEVADLSLNQGVESYGLVPNQATMVQHYLTHDGNLRDTDVLALEDIEITLTQDGSSALHELPYSGAVPAWDDFVEVRRHDIANTVNAFLIPDTGDGQVQLHTALKNRGLTVAERGQSFEFRPEFPITVLLVPIMAEGYSETDMIELTNNVNAGRSESEWRMPLTGRVRFAWSPMVMTSDESLDIGSWWELYVQSHGLDEARRQWNESHDPDALIAFGVLHEDVADTSSATGQGFWPDVSEMLNLLLLAPLNAACQATSFLVRILTFGAVGFEEYCQLEVPLYVGWASGAEPSGRMASLITHELGHIQGLVKMGAPNYYNQLDSDPDDDNATHSLYDELDVASCGMDNDADYNELKTFYRSPGVEGAVVNPLTQQQLYPQLGVSSTLHFSGTPSDSRAYTDRAKAMMSYACWARNHNSFYEPVDAVGIFGTFAATSILSFFTDLGSGGLPPSAAAIREAQAQSVSAKPPAVPGPRLYASGIITRSNDTGQLVRVQALGEKSPPSASFATGYWLVQLDGSGAELDRTGLYPVFATVEDDGDAVDNDAGFFSATLLRQAGTARIELRHDDRLLDTFLAGGAVPSVTLTSPAGGSYSSGSVPVTWTAADADGDDLTIAIDYSSDDGASWLTLASNDQDSGTLQMPVYRLAGSSQARFRVRATDGLNSGEASSAAFSVAAQPPHPYISQPEAGALVLEGELILLMGGATDNQDEDVASENLHWRSSQDGELGSGSALGVFLSAGEHSVTLKAINSAGMTATASLTLTVEGDYDYDGISDDDESASRLNPLTETDAYSDADGDGLPLIMERNYGTNPSSTDSDGDGRGDADEILAGSDPATPDAPLSPDTLQVFPKGLDFSADLALDTPMSQQRIEIVSRKPVSWTLASGPDWLAASAISGTTPAGATLLLQAFQLENGVHHGVLTFTSVALGSVISVPVTATIANAGGHYDADLDGCLNVGDVQGAAYRVPSSYTQEGFSYRHDVDRDGDVDTGDAQSTALRWVERGVCSASYPVTPVSTLRISTTTPVMAGASFTASVLLEHGPSSPMELGGFEFDLAFDPSLLQVQSVVLSTLMGSTGRQAETLGPIVDNTSGLVAFGGYSLGDQAGAVTDGELVQVTFRAIATGTSVLDLQNSLLALPSGELVAASEQDGSITVGTVAENYPIYLPLVLRSVS